MAQEGSVEKRSDDMEEPASLPTRAELQKLLGMLLFAEDEIDDVSTAIILERAGVDRDEFLERLGSRLESKAAEMRVQGKEVPQALIDTIRVLEPNDEDDESDKPGPEKVIGALLKGQVLGSSTEMNDPGQVQAFRSGGTELLTEEDLRILDEISKELQAEADEE